MPGMMIRQDPREMASWLAQGRRSGWGWAELSRRSGHPVWKLRWWHERLKRKPSPAGPLRSFVSVEITDSPRPVAAPLEVTTPAGFRLEVPRDFDPEHLRRLLKALEPSC